jgi:arabinogalactan oligomer/maltooligosaccharide transport system permease protein
VKENPRQTPPGVPRDAWSAHWPRQAATYAVLALAVLLSLAPLWQIVVHALEPATSAGVVLSATAGYALSRFRFFGRLAVLNSLLVTQIFPATMLLLPIFLILVQLQLINTFFGLILIYVATVLPFCIWQMKNFYDTIPESLEEAAAMDGCTPAEIFRRVVLPVSAQGLAVTALFSFAAAWNEYVVAAILMQDSELFTLPLGLRLLHADSMAGQPGLFAAGALIVTVPMLVLYLLLSRFLVARVGDIAVRQ